MQKYNEQDHVGREKQFKNGNLILEGLDSRHHDSLSEASDLLFSVY